MKGAKRTHNLLTWKLSFALPPCYSESRGKLSESFSRTRGIDSKNFLDQTEAIDPRSVLNDSQQIPVSGERAMSI